MQKLGKQHVNQFIDTGYLKIENAFPKAIADECVNILWDATLQDPKEPDTWTKPIIRIGELGHKPFIKAANTRLLHQAYNLLAGDNWLPRTTLGTFPIRFPGKEKAMDTGWHVDASFPGEDPDNYFNWRINVSSKGRALLMLFLFSDVTEQDAPTVIREGSHLDIAKLLEPEGQLGFSFNELTQRIAHLPKRKEVTGTGIAGTVYLCHPFLVHRAQDHVGKSPKFMAQPPLLPKRDFNIFQSGKPCCPIVKAIIKGINSWKM